MPKVKTIESKGLSVDITVNDKGMFAAYLGGDYTNRVTGPTLSDVERKVRTWLKTQSDIAIPAVIVDLEGFDRFAEITITGQHGQNLDLLYRKNGSAFRGYPRGRLCRTLTDAERAEIDRLCAGVTAAEDARDRYVQTLELAVPAAIEQAHAALNARGSNPRRAPSSTDPGGNPAQADPLQDGSES